MLDRDGLLLYVNKKSLRFYFSEPQRSEDVLGKTLHELGFPKQWADERIELYRRMEQTGQACVMRTIWQGRQQFGWMRPFTNPGSEQDFQVLVVTRRIGAGEEADLLFDSEVPVIESEVMGLGDLCVLTRRELEVLAMIGQGLTAKEIAALLHRSVKTVENHRISIGAKLHKTNKVELAIMARDAGLTVDDSMRVRMCKPSSEGCSWVL